jgi:hypothetical protein
MRKSDKKIDNKIRSILTELCDDYYETVLGFKWLTHVVDYSSFPSSLKVICVFETRSDVEQFLMLECDASVTDKVTLSVLNKHLNAIGVKVKKLDELIRYDDEESCLNEHDGNWASRLSGGSK